MKVRLLLVFFVLIFIFPSVLFAATFPDSGQILQESKKGVQVLPDSLPVVETPDDVEGATESDVKFIVSGFTFIGFEKVSTEAELQTLLAPVIGREVSLAELRRAADQVTNYLRDKGFFLARAYLPQQEIVDGIIKIAVIAGAVEGVPTVRLSETVRLKEKVISSIAEGGASSGEVLKQRQLERSILLMNDLPGISAKSVLERGDAPGTTKVTIEALEGPLLGGYFSLNNFGNRYTGQAQSVFQIAANDLTGYGDQLSFSATGSQGLKKGAIAYQLPLGTSGLKGSLSLTSLHYELGKEYKSLDAEGTATTFSAQLSYPLVRTRVFSLWQALGYEYRGLEDEVGRNDTSDRTLRVISSNTSINCYDRLWGGGLSNAFVKITAGDLDYGLTAEAAIDASTANAEGNYYTLSYSLSRLQRLTQDFTLFAAVNGQFASQNLDSSEKFILGGSSGVRAYPVGEASGDEGYSVTAEIRFDVPKKVLSSHLQCVAFLDAGRVTLHETEWTNSVTTATGKNSYGIAGLGFGANLDLPGKYSIRASFSHVIGNNSGRTTDGKNADNKDADQQLWLQAILWF